MKKVADFNLDENYSLANDLLDSIVTGNSNQHTQLDVALRLIRTTKHLEFWLSKYYKREDELNKCNFCGKCNAQK